MVQDEIQRSESDVYDIEEKLRLLKTRQEETEASMANQQKSQWLLEQQLQHLSSLKDETAALKSVVAENDRLNTEIEAINIALETLVRLSETIHDSFGRYLNQSASQLISGITGNVYDSLSVDQNLNVFLNTSRKLIPLEQAEVPLTRSILLFVLPLPIYYSSVAIRSRFSWTTALQTTMISASARFFTGCWRPMLRGRYCSSRRVSGKRNCSPLPCCRSTS